MALRVRYGSAAAVLCAAFVNLADAQPKARIELKLTCERTASEVTLTATFKNEGTWDSALVIGHATGKTEAADSLVLEVRTGGSKAVEEAVYPDALYMVFGFVAPLIVPLPKDTSFTLVRQLDRFLIASKRLSDPIRDRTVRVRLRAAPAGDASSSAAGILSDRIFTGELVSHWIHLPGECSAGPSAARSSRDSPPN